MERAALIVVHVAPRAKRSEVAGRHGDAVRIRLAAPPVDGAANDELIRFLAGVLGVPRRAVTIVHGTAARRKTVAIDGVSLDTALRALLGPTDG